MKIGTKWLKSFSSAVLGCCLLGGALAQMVPAGREGSDSGSFSGARAFRDLQHLVAFGPRPPGSRALGEARQWIVGQLKQTRAGVEVEEDSFVPTTPAGSVPMTNVIAKFAGKQPGVVILAGHYDTKRFENFRFVGANDGGSSAAFLLEMARVLSHRHNAVGYWLVFFDGEEAFEQWSATDSLYGSRHFVQKLTESGQLGLVKAMVLVDMIGDTDLGIQRDANSTGWLNDLVFETARRLGYAKQFSDSSRDMVDDHIPFVNAGVSAIDLIDFDYGPGNSYWHTAKDTPEHCSARSLEIVGRVVTAALSEIEKSPHLR